MGAVDDLDLTRDPGKVVVVGHGWKRNEGQR